MPSRTPAPEVSSYGADEAQLLCFLWPDAGVRPRGVATLIHGGYWRQQFDASLMDALALSLRDNGWVTANIEYRRGPAHPWPAPLDDVREALAVVAESKRVESVGGPLVCVGHSVGGQLALLTAELTDAVVALAPVTDVARTYREQLGDNAAREYFGASPEEVPETYRHASPLQQPVGNTEVLVLHGINDDRVPIAHSRDFMIAASSKSSPVKLVEYEDLGHIAAIDPAGAHWSGALSWLADIDGSASAARSHPDRGGS